MLAGRAEARSWPAHCRDAGAPTLCKIHKNVNKVNHLRRRMGEPRRRYHWYAEAHPAARPRILESWIRLRNRTQARYQHYQAAHWSAAWLSAALCVHSHEGSWTDPNAPYWGGMQMDMNFQTAYGPEFLARYGTANHWPAHDQLLASYRAWQSRGWTPWPNTSAMCGL